MTILFALVAVAAVAAILAFNFYPPFRDKVRKDFLPLVEGLLATAVYWVGQGSEAFVELQQAGYLPKDWVAYLPYVFMAYLLIKGRQLGKAKK